MPCLTTCGTCHVSTACKALAASAGGTAGSDQEGEALASPLGLSSPPLELASVLGLAISLALGLTTGNDGTETDGLAPGVHAASAAARARIAMNRFVMGEPLVASRGSPLGASRGGAGPRRSLPSAGSGNASGSVAARCDR